MGSCWPRISVVTAVRDGASFLARAIESLKAQEYPNSELLVLDGGSSDGTLEVIKRYEGSINYWRSRPDGGAGDAYNEGIEIARGEVIHFLNADDQYEPGILKAVGALFRSDPSLEVVSCEARVLRLENGEQIEVRRLRGRCQEISPGSTPMPNARFFRKSLFERVGLFSVGSRDSRHMYACDLEFLLRLCEYCPRNHVLPMLGYSYFMHKDSATFGGNAERERQMYMERITIAERFLKSPALTRHRGRLRRWHRRGTTRAFYWGLQERNFKKALAEARRGIRISPFAWLPDAMRIGVTRSYVLGRDSESKL